MKLVSLAGVASAALAIAVSAPAPAYAADLGGYRGSTKDGFVAPMPVVQHGPSGPCYFRADAGYSWSNDPEVKWPVSDVRNNTNLDVIDPVTGLPTVSVLSTFITDKVSNATIENTWLAEGGVGCSFGGSRGVRIEAVLGFRGNRKIDGEPGLFNAPRDTITAGGIETDVVPGAPPIVDPLHTSLKSYTLMLNAYKDFGNFGGFIPYVGAGIGAAYHQLDDVFFTDNPALTNRIKGDNDLAFAWSLMAGVGYQISDRAILDVGYRYIDLGRISSQRSDSAGFVNPAVKIDDLTAHEVKVGLRYHFGGNDCCDAKPASFQPLK